MRQIMTIICTKIFGNLLESITYIFLQIEHVEGNLNKLFLIPQLSRNICNEINAKLKKFESKSDFIEHLDP